jgi:hypothetical protein
VLVRLRYLAVAAGCVPVLLSDEFEGAFPSAVKWRDFSLRFAEADIAPRRRAATPHTPS